MLTETQVLINHVVFSTLSCLTWDSPIVFASVYRHNRTAGIIYWIHFNLSGAKMYSKYHRILGDFPQFKKLYVSICHVCNFHIMCIILRISLISTKSKKRTVVQTILQLWRMLLGLIIVLCILPVSSGISFIPWSVLWSFWYSVEMCMIETHNLSKISVELFLWDQPVKKFNISRLMRRMSSCTYEFLFILPCLTRNKCRILTTFFTNVYIKYKYIYMKYIYM